MVFHRARSICIVNLRVLDRCFFRVGPRAFTRGCYHPRFASVFTSLVKAAFHHASGTCYVTLPVLRGCFYKRFHAL